MAIPLEAKKALEEALGAENISDDPGVIETYSHMNGLGSAASGYWWARPAAVALPGSTEEVQKVVKICNEFGLRFKAHSTGWICCALATSKNCVLLDMRRMDGLEFVEPEGYVITEPYATAGETQVEAMKLGYTPHLVGAGPNASNLASATSMQGTGGNSVRTSMNERNPLAIEWVLPSGEILRLGSVDTPNAGWFCGDGPGPSLRGMMRGAVGNIGGNGVFTKIALKLYPWYGPPYECEGHPPFFKTKELPLSFVRYVSWDDRDQECDALYRLGETEILDYTNRWSASALMSSLATTNQEYREMKEKGDLHKVFPNGYWTFFFNASSKRQYDYNVKVFEHVINDTGGVIVDPKDLGDPAYEVAVQNAVRSQWIAKSAYMPTGANTGVPPLTYETIDQCLKYALDETIDVKKEWIETNKVYNDGEDNAYACLDENGHFLHVEHACHADYAEPEAEALGIIFKGYGRALEKNLGAAYMSMPAGWSKRKEYSNYMVAIQRMIDPNRTADSMLTNLAELTGA
ncbi:glycolate oxidase [Desulfatibacillum alkenivorans DSM 16219]|uniref:Glycolate oxidase n=1 Tax=Desulfatibacillum alkenivorans DSM 16219 TaxID=1121393 RepID=A0A1M6ZA16_9BACT|nr:FAD-binding oxidoreductase [Desulfatibacillum alkenivorans]SHL27282.1 glycolate oxidase [Desulfatibacillum alkenivorans DSM 16219]